LDSTDANAWYNKGVVLHNQNRPGSHEAFAKARELNAAKSIGVSKNETI
jgi:hypothetical protein